MSTKTIRVSIIVFSVILKILSMNCSFAKVNGVDAQQNMEFYIYRHPNIINVYLDSIKVYDPRGEMIYEGYLGKQQFLVDYNAFKNNIESRLLYQYDGQYSGGTLIIDWFRDDV